MKYCIQAIDKTGGSRTLLADTVEECWRAASRVGGQTIATSLPFAVSMNPRIGLYDVSIPVSWRDAFRSDIATPKNAPKGTPKVLCALALYLSEDT